MKRNGFASLYAILGGLLVIGATALVIHFAIPPSQKLGVFNPVQATRSYLSGAGIGTSDATINLTALKTPSGYAIQMGDFGTIGYGTIDAATSKEENISFSGITQNANGTAQLTGVTRGLNFVYPYGASTTLQYAHSGGSSFIISNSAPFYSQFNIAANTSTITGNWTFASSSIPVMSATTTYTNGLQIVDKAYVDSVATSGSPDAGIGSKGLVSMGSLWSSIGSPTSTDGSSVLYAVPNFGMFATSTAGTGSLGVVTQTSTGKISQTFLDLTQQFTFSGGVSSTQNTTLSSTTINGKLTVNGSYSGITANNLIDSTSSIPFLNTTATTTILSKSIPANTFGANGGARIELNISDLNLTSNDNLVYQLSLGTSTVSITYTTTTLALACGTSSNCFQHLIIKLENKNTTSQFVSFYSNVFYQTTPASSVIISTSTMTADTTNANTLSLTARNSQAASTVGGRVEDSVATKFQN